MFESEWTYTDTDKLINAYESDIEWYDEHLELLISEIKDLDSRLTEKELAYQDLKRKLEDLI